MHKALILGLLVALFPDVTAIHAQPTTVVVRAKAKDAKFIASSVGGAMVTIRTADSGTLLARGITHGSTGNTHLIMRTPHTRGMQLSDEATGKFEASIDLDQPTLVTIEVRAPYTKRQATVAASTQVWLIPGKHITGDGIVVEIPGFIVDILTPRTHQFIPLADIAQGRLPVEANVVMMCGCTISDGGLWDGSRIEVRGILQRDGTSLGEVPLTITTTDNLFAGALPVNAPGNYHLTIYAYDPATGNTGVDQVNYIVE
ncbi:MAG: hypothetical protein R3301_03960 [Saprospiraceae bacterium]|nr:hypothetical protein [Saprospiraceae bacterium]